jgi:hypothetical protein
MREMYVVLVLGFGLGLFLISSIGTDAQLDKEAPTGNLTEDVDISITPGEELPANGTVSVSTEGATDMDINEFPPQGVTVIIQNDTVVVTNNPVTYQ